MKKLLIYVLILIGVLCISGCSKEQAKDSLISTEDNQVDISEPTIVDKYEETSQPVKLSSQCELILADGEDENGNFFEIVAEEHQDYSGTITKIGVIKNNEWLSMMSENHPFIEDGKFFYGGVKISDIKTVHAYKTYIEYVGNGCFTLGSRILYNCNNCLSIDVKDFAENKTFDRAYLFNDFGGVNRNVNRNNRNNYMVFFAETSKGNKLYSLDTKTMATKEIGLEASVHSNICAYNDGLFLYGLTFCDINGNAVLDIKNYNINVHTGYKQAIVFDNGTCSFKTKNDQGTIYDIKIDKNGNVLESKQSQ